METVMQDYIVWLRARIADALESGELWMLDRLATDRAWVATQG